MMGPATSQADSSQNSDVLGVPTALQVSGSTWAQWMMMVQSQALFKKDDLLVTPD